MLKLSDVFNPLLIVRVGFAVVFLWFGIDKFFHPDFWLSFVPPFVLSALPFSQSAFIYLQGAVEAVLGLLLLVGFLTRIAALLSAIMLAAIIVALSFTAVPVRDIALLSIAVALAFAKSHSLSVDSYMQKRRRRS